MQIKTISLWMLRIPFIQPISHNLAQRSETCCIIVEIEGESGVKGYGEGTPRQYVTGETFKTVQDSMFFWARELPGRAVDEKEMIQFCDDVRTSETARSNPSAFCALETALFDLYTRKIQIPLWRFFRQEPLADSFVYSAVLPLAKGRRHEENMNIIASAGMQYIKFKVGKQRDQIEQLKQARKRFGPEVNFRVDANGAFNGDEALAFLAATEDIGFSAIEQPVAQTNLVEMKEVSRLGGLCVIADESFCSEKDADILLQENICDGFNIRLSKCGGLVNSLTLHEKIVKAGKKCQLGCHIGETGILSAAGRHFATVCPDLMYLEGSFSAYLLQHDLIKEDITFGQGGNAPLLTQPGLGITVNEEILHMSAQRVAFFS